ncbi:MAG: hypothetical protein ACO3I1_08835, partial [Burkholderiales bacterium]
MSDWSVKAVTGKLGNQLLDGFDLTSMHPRYVSVGANDRSSMLNKKTYKECKFCDFFSNGQKSLHIYSLLANYIRRVANIPPTQVCKYRSIKTLKEILIND